MTRVKDPERLHTPTGGKKIPPPNGAVYLRPECKTELVARNILYVATYLPDVRAPQAEGDYDFGIMKDVYKTDFDAYKKQLDEILSKMRGGYDQQENIAKVLGVIVIYRKYLRAEKNYLAELRKCESITEGWFRLLKATIFEEFLLFIGKCGGSEQANCKVADIDRLSRLVSGTGILRYLSEKIDLRKLRLEVPEEGLEKLFDVSIDITLRGLPSDEQISGKRDLYARREAEEGNSDLYVEFLEKLFSGHINVRYRRASNGEKLERHIERLQSEIRIAEIHIEVLEFLVKCIEVFANKIERSDFSPMPENDK